MAEQTLPLLADEAYWKHPSHAVLRFFYCLFPFDLKGNWKDPCSEPQAELISCLIPGTRARELNDLLEDLSLQTLPVSRFEVIVLDDTPQGSLRTVCDQYHQRLKIIYARHQADPHVLGRLRNRSLELSRGQYLLFLDDDTRLMQKDFLEKALALFKETKADGILPKASVSFGLLAPRVDYLDAFSMTTRCCLLTRSLLQDLGGFLAYLKAYEDIELSLRLAMAGQRLIIKTTQLQYTHPPLYFEGMKKPLAIGESVLRLKKIYRFPVWLLVYLNALRFLPCGLLPWGGWHQYFKISLGVLLYPLNRKPSHYGGSE